ncbi:T9SS type A sorting domain-containing protein [Epilithonimonas sp. UC225_85]|uniref:T9SS type A sorting domain-containing protein n=1 Tax=Epilithonimonas sp. UC225_85 TaxID=3350167 RepID=UPI0036D26B35
MKTYLFLFLSLLSLQLYAQGDLINTRLIQPTSTSGNFNQSYIHHLNSSKNELFLSTLSIGVSEYFGFSNVAEDRYYISRIGSNGLPKWTTIVYAAQKLNMQNSSQDFAAVDKDDNIYVLCRPNGLNPYFVDAFGTTVYFYDNFQMLLKINKDGKLVWKKNYQAFSAGVCVDNNNDVYLYGTALSITNTAKNFSLIKLNGQTGNEIYVKDDFNLTQFQFVPTFDNSNNLYVFTEPVAGTSDNLFSVGNLNISLNTDGFNSIMLKFDVEGNILFGKNFYPVNSDVPSYSWINDAKFDGEKIVLNGNYLTTNKDSQFLGMGGIKIDNHYNTNYAGLIAKIDLNGSVEWEKDIQSSKGLSLGFYTNIGLDEEKNIYGYFGFKEKVTYNNTEYIFNTLEDDRVITKIDSNGNLKFFKSIDQSPPNNQNTYYYNLIDMISVDKFNCLGNTNKNNFLNIPLSNDSNPKMYIATFANENLFTDSSNLINFRIYPNPTSDILNIQTEQKISKIEIFDTSGKLLKSNSGNEKNIRVSELTKGLYLIKIYADKNVINSKFIKN